MSLVVVVCACFTNKFKSLALLAFNAFEVSCVEWWASISTSASNIVLSGGRARCLLLVVREHRAKGRWSVRGKPTIFKVVSLRFVCFRDFPDIGNIRS